MVIISYFVKVMEFARAGSFHSSCTSPPGPPEEPEANRPRLTSVAIVNVQYIAIGTCHCQVSRRIHGSRNLASGHPRRRCSTPPLLSPAASAAAAPGGMARPALSRVSADRYRQGQSASGGLLSALAIDWPTPTPTLGARISTSTWNVAKNGDDSSILKDM